MLKVNFVFPLSQQQPDQQEQPPPKSTKRKHTTGVKELVPGFVGVMLLPTLESRIYRKYQIDANLTFF